MTTIGYLRSVREWAYPQLKSSAFLEKGVLTPEEFVNAGDELVYRCPTWCWESGDGKNIKSYLPHDKQYLITRNVPCQNRVSSLENHYTFDNENIDGNDNNDDWLVSNIINNKNDDNIEDDFDILDEEGEIIEKTSTLQISKKDKNNVSSDINTTSDAAVVQDGDDDDDDDEYADMEDFEDDNILQEEEDDDDDDTEQKQGGGGGKSTNEKKDDDDDDLIMKVRTYNLSITYDKYYQTPRIWMLGTSANGQPLSGKEMMEDVMSDYANRTVTIENHPHVTGPHASIHPCQHAKVMKKIVKNLIKANPITKDDENNDTQQKGPSVEMYLFIFLKFVNSIIPTINYDFTINVKADTSK